MFSLWYLFSKFKQYHQGGFFNRKLLLPFFYEGKGCVTLFLKKEKMDYQVVLKLSIDHISAGKYDSQFPFLRYGFPSHIPQEEKKCNENKEVLSF